MNKGIVIVMAALLTLAGCQKKSRAVSLPPGGATRTVSTPAPATPAPTSPAPASPAPVAPAPSPSMAMFEAADRAFNNGDYVQAARSYESYLRSEADGDREDEALFRLGLIYGSPESPNRDWARASMHLKQLLDEYPDSEWSSAASLLMSLYSEVNQLRTDGQQRDQRIKQLNSELEKLKKIDASRKKP